MYTNSTYVKNTTTPQHQTPSHTPHSLPDDLFALLSGGRGLSEVYLALLKVVMEEEEDQAMRKELKPTKKQKDLEEIARRYLHRTGRNVSWGKGRRGKRTVRS